MEFIKISEKKMKIMLTPADMTLYDLSNESFTEPNGATQKAFRLLLEDVKKRTGFGEEDDELSVQYFPSREGGCEMFISSLPPSANNEDKKKALFLKAPKPSNFPTVQKHFCKECVYRFSNLEKLLSVCKRLLNTDFSGESKAYEDDSGSYYLYIKIMTDIPFNLPEEYFFLNEYGKMQNCNLLRIYFSEHAKSICNQGAVECLGLLA